MLFGRLFPVKVSFFGGIMDDGAGNTCFFALTRNN